MINRFVAGWRQVGACLALLSLSALIASTYSVVAMPLAAEFKPTRMVLMLAMTIMALVCGLLSPLFGSLMDKLPLRRLMAIGAALMVSGFVALSFATSFNQVLIIYGLFMAPANTLIGPMIASVLLSRWFVKRRGTALGIAISGIALGGFVFPPVVQGLLDGFPWRDAFRLIAVMVLLIAAPAIALVIDRPSDRGLHPDGADHDPDAGGTAADAPALSTRALLADPTFWLAALVFSVVIAGMKGMVTNLVPLAVDVGITATSAALLISVYAACGFVAKLGFGLLADRLESRALMFVSLAGFAFGMACLVRADAGYAWIATGAGLIGLFGGVMVPLQGLLIARIYGPRVVGRVTGTMSVVILCASLATPPLFGLIYDLTGNYDGVVLAFTALAAAAMLLVPHIRTQAREAAPAAPLPA